MQTSVIAPQDDVDDLPARQAQAAPVAAIRAPGAEARRADQAAPEDHVERRLPRHQHEVANRAGDHHRGNHQQTAEPLFGLGVAQWRGIGKGSWGASLGHRGLLWFRRVIELFQTRLLRALL
ncbi:hypothetical protein HUS74_03045 [Pandoraea nosoerga]|nr:hypothetical protein [Pandoraea nosoerga]